MTRIAPLKAKASSCRLDLLRPLLAAMLVLFSLNGCRDEGKEEKPQQNGQGPRWGGTVVIGWTTDLESINPLISAGSSASDDVVSQIFLQLMEEQPDFAEHPPTFVPQLARAYEWSDGHKILTFHLRNEMTWSDGVPVTAEDVKWTWEVETNKIFAWDKAYTKEAITGVEVVDQHTVRFYFSHAYAKQLLDAIEGPILPKHAWDKLPVEQWREKSAWFWGNLVVDGPFTVESWKPEKELVLRRNVRYWNRPWPYLDRVKFLILPDQEKLAADLFSGKIDFIPQVTPRDAIHVRNDPRFELITYWHRLAVAIVWNNQRTPFDNREVRSALAMGLDRNKIMEAIFPPSEEYARLATSPIVGLAWVHNRLISPPVFDESKAREILAVQGFVDPDGGTLENKNGKPLNFGLVFNAGNKEREMAASIIKDQLHKIGVRVEGQKMPFKDMMVQLKSGNFDAAIIGLSMDTSFDLTGFYHSRSIQKGLNYARYNNPEVDRLITRAMGRPNILDSHGDLDKVQEIVSRDQPYTLLWESKRLNAVNRRVRDVRPNTISPLFNLEEWWVDSRVQEHP